MEKIEFKNSRNIKLVGIYYPSKSKKAIIISHGSYANKDRIRLV